MGSGYELANSGLLFIWPYGWNQKSAVSAAPGELGQILTFFCILKVHDYACRCSKLQFSKEQQIAIFGPLRFRRCRLRPA
jgi:hypothetical protein